MTRLGYNNLRDGLFFTTALIQSFVYRSKQIHGDRPMSQNTVNMMGHWLDGYRKRNLISNYRLVTRFNDPTIESNEIIRVYLQETRVLEFIVFELDLMKDIHECIRFVNNNNLGLDVDVFNVIYRDGDIPENETNIVNPQVEEVRLIRRFDPHK